MNKPHHFNNAKAIIGLLALAIIFVVFYKFVTNQDLFFTDPNALRNYVMFAIVGGGFLIGLVYLASKTEHKPTKAKVTKSPKSKKKKR